jgi:3-oxoacyl-[acyl-carrier protein] reductase
MELNLRGRTVVITGGSSGIGKGTAREYLKEGCNVAICARGKERLDEAYREFHEEGHEIFTKSVDVTDHDALASFADETAKEFGKIDVWYNNAGLNPGKALMDYDIDEFRTMTDKLLVSDFSGCKIAAGHMRRTGGGVIMNASSLSATMPMAGRGVYGACKAGVNILTQVFAAELACDNIRVLAYSPGTIITELTKEAVAARREQLMESIPVRRFGTVEETAKILVFLSSDACSYINGVHIDITGAKFCVQNPQFAWGGKKL